MLNRAADAKQLFLTLKAKRSALRRHADLTETGKYGMLIGHDLTHHVPGGKHTHRALRKTDTDMTQGTIWKQLLSYSVPLLVGLIFQQLYNMVDTVVVGRFVGKAALAAVGSTGSIVNMLVGFCAGLATGASVVISQCYGAKDMQRLHDAVHTTIVITFGLCAVMTALGLLIVEPALRMMDTPEDVIGEARVYLTIYFAGMSGMLIYNMQRISIHLVHRTISKQKRNPPIPTHDPLDHQQPPKLLIPNIQHQWAGRKHADESPQHPCAIHLVHTWSRLFFLSRPKL